MVLHPQKRDSKQKLPHYHPEEVEEVEEVAEAQQAHYCPASAVEEVEAERAH